MKNFEFDEIDRKIVKILMEDTSITYAVMGELAGLSASAVSERIKKLKSANVIRKMVAFIDSSFIEMELGAFISVVVEGKKENSEFIKKVVKHENILECHHLTGEYSYILKVRVANTKALESFISDFLKGQAGVIKTTTQVILSSHKENSVVVN